MIETNSSNLSSSSDSMLSSSDTSFDEHDSENKPNFFTQEALNDLFRDLDLSKDKSELLASRLKQRKLLTDGVKITAARKRHEDFSKDCLSSPPRHQFHLKTLPREI